MRTPLASCGLLLILSAGARVAAQCDPPVLACTPVGNPGLPGFWDESISDLAFTADGRVWVLEGPMPGFNDLERSRVTVYNQDLVTGRVSLDVSFDEPAFGIAEVPPHHPHAGNFYVLMPGTFPQPGSVTIAPAIGIMDRNGVLLAEAPFAPVLQGAVPPPPGFYTAIDAHPSAEELVLLDDGRIGNPPHVLFVDLSFQVLRGPFPLEGNGGTLAGGVAYSGEDTVVALSQFRTPFEVNLALEYDRDGVYTGRCSVLDAVGAEDPEIAVGIDTGTVGAQAAIFLYDVLSDAIYALPFDGSTPLPASGPVAGLDPACAVQETGQVLLTWTVNPAYGITGILILENGVVVASLPGDATSFLTPVAPSGKFELCLETRGADPSANPLRVCCEGESGVPLPFLPPGRSPGQEVDVDPFATNPHFQLGLACAPVVERKEDFRMFVVGSYDNQIRVVDFKGDPLPQETIATSPATRSTIQGGAIVDLAASGLALLDLVMDGQEVSFYAILDGDGAGDFVPRASLHFLRDTTLPGNPTPVLAGTRLGTSIDQIDFGGSPTGRFLVDWDTDASGDLITLDSEGRAILRIRYDPVEHSLRMLAEAPLVMNDLTPFQGQTFPVNGISVLPSGHYLVAGGDVFDSTTTRAFLVTPFVGDDPRDPDPELSVKMVGHVDGLLAFSQLTSPEFFGRTIGPDFGFGLESAFFRGEEAPQGVGAVFYNMLHYFPTPLQSYTGNLLVGLRSSAVDPALRGDPILDDRSTVAGGGTMDSGPRAPDWAAEAASIDYHVHLFNTDLLAGARFSLEVHLDGSPVPALGEAELAIPAGRSLYRRFPGRTEKELRLVVRNLESAGAPMRLLAGATARTGGEEVRFRRGDANDDGAADISDPVVILGFLFLGGAAPTCFDAADADDTGILDLTDPIYVLDFLFRAGPAPPAPGPVDCGVDPTEDAHPACAAAGC